MSWFIVSEREEKTWVNHKLGDTSLRSSWWLIWGFDYHKVMVVLEECDLNFPFKNGKTRLETSSDFPGVIYQAGSSRERERAKTQHFWLRQCIGVRPVCGMWRFRVSPDKVMELEIQYDILRTVHTQRTQKIQNLCCLWSKDKLVQISYQDNVNIFIILVLKHNLDDTHGASFLLKQCF